MTNELPDNDQSPWNIEEIKEDIGGDAEKLLELVVIIILSRASLEIKKVKLQDIKNAATELQMEFPAWEKIRADINDVNDRLVIEEVVERLNKN